MLGFCVVLKRSLNMQKQMGKKITAVWVPYISDLAILVAKRSDNLHNVYLSFERLLPVCLYLNKNSITRN
jgi:hypothetical protein